MARGEVRLTGVLHVPAGRLAAVMAALPAHVAASRAEPGCLAFTVTPDPADATRLRVAELFASKAAFEAHQRRAAASPWGRITRGLQRNYEITIDAD